MTFSQNPLKRLCAASLAVLCMTGAAVAQDRDGRPQVIEEIVVSGRLTQGTRAEQALSHIIVDRAQLALSPQGQLDEALKVIPGFGLFRRSAAAIANPTSQGVSLRSLGPNGAGRTLVLLDGVPMNDPFGGWVAFSRLPAALIDQARLTPGGGAGIWGNSAIAGTLRLTSRRDQGVRAEVANGRFGNAEGLLHAAFDQTPISLSVDGLRFTRGGYRVIDRAQAGPVDIPAWSDGQSGQAMINAEFGSVRATAKLGAFSENRSNGTPLAVNKTRASDASLRLYGGKIGMFSNLEAMVYGQRTVFANRFTSVDATRKIETPALDQFSVPANAYGGSLSGELALSPQAGAIIGLDGRKVEGATNELFQYVSGAFSRLRVAGGQQAFTGLFIEPYWALDPRLLLTAGLRADHWSIFGGRRIETALTGSNVFRSDRYADRSGTLANGRIGLSWQAVQDLSVRASGYSGFRVPTLNELFRPFRVGGDIIEANPNLAVEHLAGGEFGADWGSADTGLLSMTYYQVQIRNAVDNVQLSDRPGLFVPLNIVVPAGGSLAQRLNLDAIDVKGIELRGQRSLGEMLRAELSYLWSLPWVDRAKVSPALVGRRLAQTARHQGSLSVIAQLDPQTTARMDIKAQSAAFEDGLNTRRLGANITGDLRLNYRINRQLSVFGAVQNVWDRKIETGLRADGLLSVGAPRQWTLGISAAY